MPYPLDRKLAVEFIGMFLFVFTVGMATESANKSGAILAPLAIGSVLMVLVFAGGHVSGGHYNPAVSTAVWIRGKIKANEYVLYVLTQFAAAALAGLLVNAIGGKQTAGLTASTGKMLVVEFLFTFALAYVVLNVATAAGTDGQFVLWPGDRLRGRRRRDLGRLDLGRRVQPRDCAGGVCSRCVPMVTHLDLHGRRLPRRGGRRSRVPLHSGRLCEGGAARRRRIS